MLFWQIIGAAWRGAYVAILRNPAIFFVGFVALIATNICFNYFAPPMQHAFIAGPHSHYAPRATPFSALISLLRMTVETIIFAPLMIVVHRSILIGEQKATLRNRSRLATFFVDLLFIQMLSELPSRLEAVVQRQSPIQVGLLLGATFAGWIITIRFLLAYPAAALDRPASLKGSWSLTKGKWWYTTAVLICGSAPLMVISLAILVISSPGSKPLVFGDRLVVSLVFTAPVIIFSIAVEAALLSELYRKFGGLDGQRLVIIGAGNTLSRATFTTRLAIYAGVFVLLRVYNHIFPSPHLQRTLAGLAVSALVPMVVLFAVVLFLKSVKRSRP